MDEKTIEQRLNLLEQRVRELETRAGVLHPPAAVVLPAAARAPAIAPIQAPAVVVPPPAAVPKPLPHKEASGRAASGWAASGWAALDAISAPAVPPPLPAVASPRRPQVAKDRGGLEQAIGIKWAGWIGAIVLVIGAGLGIQFAYENHWFGHLPPALRLGFIFAARAGLIGTGEIVYRRVSALSAVGLFAAGVATCFVGAYAGYQYFDLYDSGTSMVLMAASTLVGAGIALRGNLASIGILSLIGANLAPLLVGKPNAPVVPFLFYLLMLQCVAQAQAFFGRGGKWWTLRGMALGPMAFWMMVILLGHHGQERPVLAFMLLFAAVYHAELILTTLRQGQLDGMEENRNVGHAGSAFVVCVWAALTIGVLTYFADAAADVRSCCVVGLAAIAGLLGFGLGQVSSSLSRLALSHRIAAAGLLVLSIPIATSGVRVEVGWMILAVAFAATWAMGGSRIARVAAPVVWLLAVLHIGARAVGLFDESFGSTLNGARLGETWLTVMNVQVGSTPILAWLAAIAGHVVAALITPQAQTRDERWLANARLVGLASGLIWVTASIYGLPNLGATAWIVAYGWMLIGAEVCGVPVSAPNQAAAILLITAGLSIEIDRTVSRAVKDGWVMMLLPWQVRQLGWTILWSLAFSALFAAAAMVGVGQQRGRWLRVLWRLGVLLAIKFVFVDTLWQFSEPVVGVRPFANMQILAGVAVALLLIFGTLEVDQIFSLASMRQSLSHAELAEHVAMSIFWSIFAVACLAAGFWKRVANLRYFALTLLALTLLKVVVVDLSQAEYGYRVLSFIGLGVLLLGTSVMYGKVSPKLLARVTSRE